MPHIQAARSRTEMRRGSGGLPKPGLMWTIVLLTLASACVSLPGSEAPTPQSAPASQLIVFAASSLTDAFDEIGKAFTAQHPGVEVTFSYGGSSTLAAQINEGSPADVFASANDKQMGVVQTAGRIAGETTLFVTNRLVVITPSSNPAGVHTLADLARPGVKLLLAAPGVPVRDFAEAMFDKAVQDASFGSDFKQRVLANLVSEEQNVRQVTAKIALGEADAGVVYVTDVTSSVAGQLALVDVPPELNVIAQYPIAVVSETKQPELARAFVDFVLGAEGQGILAKWGFSPPPAG